ncbi:MAG: SpoIIE family protein phosphatase, partial [Planctomycetes bacterium]|nr:SpoIIE family protein phosphatase [Planctomycetota bacterium]
SVMCAPLWSQDGKAFGVIQLDTQDRHKKFMEDDLKMLMGIASQASIALENARMHQDLVARERIKRDLEVAREVQRSFLPTRLPGVSGYEFFAHYEAALEVSGDYYDFIPLPGKCLAILVGDVAGKGVAAALLMAKISADARFCMLTESNLAVAISRLNDLMLQGGMAERFVTLAAAVLDPAKHELTLVNAGHPSPLIYRHATTTLEEATPNDSAGLPIGVMDGFQYESCQVQLHPGDSLLIFTDGVTEAMDVQERQLEIKGIHAALQGGHFAARALGDRVLQAVKRHAAGRSQHDDITLVSFGRTS